MLFQSGVVSTGCTNSPENPSIILGLIGLFVGWIFSRFNHRYKE